MPRNFDTALACVRGSRRTPRRLEDTMPEELATSAPVLRWAAMLDEDCLNVRLGDYFHQRREAASDLPTGDAEPDDSAASGTAAEQGTE